ncbi:hypothetical protein N0V95_008840 [Ascochyta clinopodiicola]|nr:hypothetical protein N0V95_008840 [Ascochyta clinopodiicola]
MAEPYGQLFGKLPDPIRLHEQMSQFDGQVVFIGHPNRDISAHQWSSSSFQWVNIGRYAQSCSKVEGSLASDRPRGIDEPRDTLEYFKLAAENRETLIIQNGRPKDHSSVAGHELHADTNASRQTESHSALPLKVCTPFKKDPLEDPFVAAASASMTRSGKNSYVQSEAIDSTGSLDLTYRFPKNATTITRSNVGAGTFDRRSTQSQAFKPSSAPTLLEVAFGEEAASSRRVTSTGGELLRGMLSSAPQKSFCNLLRGLSKVRTSQPTLPVQDSVAESTRSLKSVACYALPTPSAASSNYVASKLNATAVPYARIETAATGSGVSESNASTADAPVVGLNYSDPDGLRKSQTYEVTNGLGQQAPTRQSFKGPFFTETKPTTHDPTVALSVQISEEEKLSNWFHDGHRPARQKEYTKSLIAAAAASSGRYQQFGAIGESFARQAGEAYANTGLFVRLYENLSEYVEEHGDGSGQWYFTRRWKAGGVHLRGMGPDDNTSYFYKEKTAPVLVRGALLRPSERMWC